MIRLKYSSVPFGKMTADELCQAAYNLLLEIHVITGWVVPGEQLMDILVEQTRLKLSEGYAQVNPEEMKYAFRNNTQVKDWGKAMNLSLIDEVMLPYLEKRRELSVMEEQKEPVALIEWKEDMSNKAMNEWIEQIRALVLNGSMKAEFLPVLLYTWLVGAERLKVSGAEKREYLLKAVQYREIILAQGDSVDDRKKLNQFLRMKETGCFEGEETEVLKNLAKRLVLYDFLNVKVEPA